MAIGQSAFEGEIVLAPAIGMGDPPYAHLRRQVALFDVLPAKCRQHRLQLFVAARHELLFILSRHHAVPSTSDLRWVERTQSSSQLSAAVRTRVNTGSSDS